MVPPPHDERPARTLYTVGNNVVRVFPNTISQPKFLHPQRPYYCPEPECPKLETNGASWPLWASSVSSKQRQHKPAGASALALSSRASRTHRCTAVWQGERIQPWPTEPLKHARANLVAVDPRQNLKMICNLRGAVTLLRMLRPRHVSMHL